MSTRKDALAIKVTHLLESKAHSPVLLAVDDVAYLDEDLSVFIGPGVSRLSYQGVEIPFEAIDAAWYWHAEIYLDQDRSSHLALEREMRQSIYGILAGVNEERWMNSPYRIRITQEKLSQMFHAMDVGLHVPPTMVANHWDVIERLGERTIIKMPVVGLLEGDVTKAMHTTILSRKHRRLLVKTSPFPGIHQPYLAKKREWRITIVGDAVFPVAVYTASDAKDDWRRHQHEKGKVRFVSEPLPDKVVETKCKALLRKLGLRYGAFDFIETPKGEMIFLEVNSTGQYGWLEHELNLPISEAIADLLIEIADAPRE